MSPETVHNLTFVSANVYFSISQSFLYLLQGLPKTHTLQYVCLVNSIKYTEEMK